MTRTIDREFFVNWFDSNGRDFPWRHEGVNQFQILITEMLLRQTDAPSVARIWNQFFTRFPDIRSIARARRNTLIKHIRILGLSNQRSLALKRACSWLVIHHSGDIPTSVEELLMIPHVGDYTARAVMCFGFERRSEIVDTNVQRFLGRFYGLILKPDVRQNPVLTQIARDLMPRSRKKAKKHNYGLLDFTAEICRARAPQCDLCSFSTKCEWRQKSLGLNRSLRLSSIRSESKRLQSSP